MNNYLFKGYGYTITFFIFALVLNCDRQGEIPEDLVAQVNDKYLEKQHVLFHVPNRLDSELQFALKKNIIDRWVENEILYQSALNEGLTLNSKEEYQLEELRKSLIVERYLDQKLNRDYRISQKNIEDYYRDHKGEFIRIEDEAHIIHVLLEQKDQAIFRDIREASNLKEIIEKYYLDERSSQKNPNDDLGYVQINRLPEPIIRRIRQMKTGTISRDIKTEQGYHFIQLIDFQKAGSIRDLDLVRDEIILRLKKEKREEELQRLKSELKQNFQVQTYLSKIQ
jgi:parvulin-like peptidyl-prolyl isomerase